MKSISAEAPAAPLAKNLPPPKRSHQSKGLRKPRSFPPLDAVMKPQLTTAECAYYLGLSEGTLHWWSSTEVGLLRPIKIGHRLGWSTAEVRRILTHGEKRRIERTPAPAGTPAKRARAAA